MNPDQLGSKIVTTLVLILWVVTAWLRYSLVLIDGATRRYFGPLLHS